MTFKLCSYFDCIMGKEWPLKTSDYLIIVPNLVYNQIYNKAYNNKNFPSIFMATRAQKEELARLREQFMRDLAKLREVYDNLELAQLTGIDPANLSSYGSGKKLPGIKVLNQFYLALHGKIESPLEKINKMENKKGPKGPTQNTKGQTGKQKQAANYNLNDRGSDNKTEEAAVVPLYKEKESEYVKEIISLLKAENAHLRSTSNKMLDGSDKLFQLPFRWLETIDKTNQITLNMSEAHKMMIVAFLQKLVGEGKPN